MSFELKNMSNDDGKSGGVFAESPGVHFSVAGLPGLPGNPTQSELEAHIVSEIKKAMQRALDNM